MDNAARQKLCVRSIFADLLPSGPKNPGRLTAPKPPQVAAASCKMHAKKQRLVCLVLGADKTRSRRETR